MVQVWEGTSPRWAGAPPQEAHAPRGKGSRVLAAPKPSNIYRGRGGAAPPLGFPPQGWRQPPDPIWEAAKGEREGGAPRVGLRAHLRLGFAPSPLEDALGPWWEAP